MISQEKISNLSRKMDCSLELFSEKSKTTSVFFEKDGMHSKESIFREGFGIRAIKNRKIGFCAFEREDDLEKSAKIALKLSAFAAPFDYFFSGMDGRSEKFFDKKALGLKDWAPIELESMLDVHKEKNTTPVSNIISCAITLDLLMNSEGGNVEKKASGFSAMSQCGYREAESSDAQSGAKFFFSPRQIAKNASDFAKSSVNAKEILGGKKEVVFDIRAIYELFGLFLEYNLSAESLRKKITRTSIGMEISPGNISIYDDPTLENGALPCEFDDEANITKKTALIGKGAVRSYASDMATAAKMGGKISRNGFRHSFETPPSISFTNISVEGGDALDLAMECKNGIYLNSFLTSGANSVTGDFSFPILIAHEIKNGEIGKPVKNLLMKGNFFELMKSAVFERKTEIYNGLKCGKMKTELEFIS
ncbi:TldD/PmbA family protein [Candidatus Micrarchaeota archaeon]|nr:TldD/PmbA family protein [Candidatus Micrarchaeota archaeon]